LENERSKSGIADARYTRQSWRLVKDMVGGDTGERQL
jgi:hypothetical protein